MKKKFATVTAGLALSGFAGVGLSAGLASPADATTPPRSLLLPHPPPTGQHPLRAWLQGTARPWPATTVQISAETIGIIPRALVERAALGPVDRPGGPAHGVDAQTVVNALVQAGDTQVSRAVTTTSSPRPREPRSSPRSRGCATKLVDHVRSASAGDAPGRRRLGPHRGEARSAAVRRQPLHRRRRGGRRLGDGRGDGRRRRVAVTSVQARAATHCA